MPQARLLIPALLLYLAIYQVMPLSNVGESLMDDRKLTALAQFYQGPTYERPADQSSKFQCPGTDCPLNNANFNNGAGDGWKPRGTSIYQRTSDKYWNRVYYFAVPMTLPSFAAKAGSKAVLHVSEIRGATWRLFVNGVEKANSTDSGSQKLIPFISDGGREGELLLIGLETEVGQNFDPGMGSGFNMFVSVPEIAQLLENHASATLALEVVPDSYGRFVFVILAALGCFFIPFPRATLFYAIGTGLWAYLSLNSNGIIDDFFDLGVDEVTERTMIYCLFYGSIFAFFSAFLRRPRKESIFFFGVFSVLALAVFITGRAGYGKALVPFIIRHHYLILSCASVLGCVLSLRAFSSTRRKSNAGLRMTVLFTSSILFACWALALILLQGWIWDFKWMPMIDSYEKRFFLRRFCEGAMTFYGVLIAIEWAVMAKDREKVLKRFGLVVDRRTMATLLKTNEIPSTMIQNLVVLFVDLREFTNMCSKLSPTEVTTALNEYLDAVTTAVKSNHGSIDKFVGDEVMALWGGVDSGSSAPHPMNAIRAAIDIRKRMRELNLRRVARGEMPLRCGIGIHVGSAIVGPVGNAERIDYTAIGPTVNLAARLQSLTKTKRFDILISRDLADGLIDKILVQDLGLNHVRGFEQDVYVFALLGVLDQDGSMRFDDLVLQEKLAGRGPGICQDAPENLVQAA